MNNSKGTYVSIKCNRTDWHTEILMEKVKRLRMILF